MKSLRHFLQNELYNLFHSKSFLFVLLILLLIVTADDILAYKSYKDNLQLTLTTVDLQADGTFAEYPFLQIYTLYNSWIGGRANETLPMVFFLYDAGFCRYPVQLVLSCGRKERIRPHYGIAAWKSFLLFRKICLHVPFRGFNGFAADAF